MANEPQVTSAADRLAKLKEISGAPLYLSAADTTTYDEMLVQLLQCYKPQDFMEELLIADFAVETWAARGHRRHADLAVKRMLRRLREVDAQRKKLAAQEKERRARAAAEKADKPATELDRVDELEHIAETSIEDVDQILDRPPVELEYAEALEKTIERREQIDTMLNSAVGRRNNDLRLLELYREGQRLRQASDETIDAEFKDATPQISQVEAPLVAPAEGNQ
jgi:hypothetical protein